MTIRGESKQKNRIAKAERKRASRLRRFKSVRMPLKPWEASKYGGHPMYQARLR